MSKPGKINDVLARFEQTIQQNEAAGGGGGMYLTNVAASKNKPPKPIISSRTMTGEATGGPASRRMSVSSGSYRNFLHSDNAGGKTSSAQGKTNQPPRGDSTVSTASMSDQDWGDQDWDPFADDEENDDQSENNSSAEEECEERRVSRHRRATRPCSSKRVGRLGNRKTRTTARGDTRAPNGRDNSLDEVAEASETSTNNEEPDDVSQVSGATRDRRHRVHEKPADLHRTGRSTVASSGTRQASRRLSRR